MAEPFGRDLDLEHRARWLELIAETQTFAFGSFPLRSSNRGDEWAVAEDIEALLERPKVVGADEHERRPAVPGDKDAVVLLLDAISQLGEVGFRVRERDRIAHRSEF